MISSRAKLLLLPARNLGLLVRRRPITSLVAGLCFLLLLAWGIYQYWVHIHLWEAQRAFALDLLPEATVAINSYLELRPNDPEARLLASRIERLRENFSIAAKHLDEYMRIERSRERSQLEWYLLRAMAGDRDKVGDLPEVETGLLYALEKNEPHRILILEALAFQYIKELRFGMSMVFLEKWLKEEPDNVRALSWRGLARENLNYKDDAKDDYQRVLGLSPKHLDTRRRLVHTLFLEKSIAQAAEHLRILERDHPDHPEVIYALALGRAFQGQAEEAIELLDRLLVKKPFHAPALHQRGKLALDPAEQEKWYRKALQIDPSFSEAHYSLHICLKTQPNRGKEAEAELIKYKETQNDWITLQKVLDALERTPNNPDLLAAAGSLLLARSPLGGLDYLNKALAIAPDHKKAHEILAEYFEKTKQPAKAALHRKMLAPPPK